MKTLEQYKAEQMQDDEFRREYERELKRLLEELRSRETGDASPYYSYPAQQAAHA